MLHQEYFAKVLINFGKDILVSKDDGEVVSCINHKITPCVAGDNISFVSKDNQSNVCNKRFNRDNELEHKGKAVAANINYLNLVVAINPHYQFDLINRYLVIANKLNIKIRIIVNKMDLCQDEEQIRKDFKIYQNIGYEVFFLGLDDKNSIENINKVLKDKTNLFIGQSGVGKSTLINILIPNLDLLTQKLSKTNLGKHTTTYTRLYSLIDGGYLIDSPGIREFNLDNLSPEDIKSGFVEFFEFSHFCKFRNCFHIDEPKCGVRDAVENYKISEKRYESYLNLL